MKISQKAFEAFDQIIREQEIPGASVRIYTVQGCCSPSLQMTVTDKPEPGDQKVEIDGMVFYIDSMAETILSNVTIDFGTNGFWLERTEKTDN
ncbi:MAG: HesB/IscA family protein [Bacteroidales bacterium]